MLQCQGPLATSIFLHPEVKILPPECNKNTNYVHYPRPFSLTFSRVDALKSAWPCDLEDV